MQDDTLSEVVSSVDVATKKNLDDLVKVGEGLLKKPVSRINLETGIFEASNSNSETNEQALIRHKLNPFNTFFFIYLVNKIKSSIFA